MPKNKTFDNAHTMPCQSIIWEDQTFTPGQPAMLDLIDAHGRRAAHQKTKSAVKGVTLWPEGDIKEIRTELGRYITEAPQQNWYSGDYPLAVVHYYNTTDGAVREKKPYFYDKDLCADLKKHYKNNGNHDIMIYIDLENALTFQRVVNVALRYAGSRPHIASIKPAAQETDSDLL